MSIDKLLAVLDMNEEEQRQEIGRNYGTSYHCGKRDKWMGNDWTVVPCSKCGKQWEAWTERKKDKSRCLGSSPYKGSLADLAFRLRDEAGQGHFVNGITNVFEHLYGYSDYKSVVMWMCSEECKSIHWIIAALIAKQLAKDPQ